jgi:hypothetical protein
MAWNDIVEKVAPYVVKIETPNGHGTGFLCLYNEDHSIYGLATAYHVVEHADRWQQPIRVLHHSSNTTAFINEERRVILSDDSRDSAVILCWDSDLELPQQLIPILPVDHRLPIGVEVGWIGYPSISRYTQCFFSGKVSAVQDFRHGYLIDGVAINGVSGGPVLYSSNTEGVQIVGLLTAYMVNRATGEALPGLSVAQDVSHLHEAASRVKNVDEAKRKGRADSAAANSVDDAPPARVPVDVDPPPK